MLCKAILFYFSKFFTYFLLAGKQPLKEHAAVWIPDNEVTVCMNCKTKFTTLNRRVRASLSIKLVHGVVFLEVKMTVTYVCIFC